MAAIYVATVYLSLAWARRLVAPLRDAGHLRLSVGLILGGAVLTAALWAIRRRPSPRQWASLGAVAALYLPLLLWSDTPEEKLHLFEYGVLGGLLYRALTLRAQRLAHLAATAFSVRHPALTACLWSGVAGWVDEGIQELLISRVYDLRDVTINLFAGTLAVSAMVLFDRVRIRP